MNDASKEYYLTEVDAKAQNKFIKLTQKLKDYFLTITEYEKRPLFYELLADKKLKFTAHPDEAKNILLSLTEEGRSEFLAYSKVVYDETLNLSKEHISV